MARWEPNARERLERAALALFTEHGFDATTVAEIADRAGLTKSTFFRHFADKREVLFGGSHGLQDLMVGAVTRAPASAAPIDAVGAALQASAVVLNNREYSRQRQAVVAASEELRERELIKMATLTSAIAEALRRRGVKEPTASLTAEAGIAVFRVAFARWVGSANRKELGELMRESLDQLRVAISA